MNGSSLRIDGAAPLFFLSYARGQQSMRLPVQPRDLDNNVLRFFADLCIHVSELVSPPTGTDPGFIDRSIGGGERWERELLTAAATCQVFVPLISPSYLNSRWCEKEWAVFASRTVTRVDGNAPGHETAIVPVTWVPTESGALPTAIRGIQRFSPERLPDPQIAVQYHENGTYGLLTTNQEDAYRNVVWKLAQRVSQICLSHRVEPLDLESTAMEDR